MRLLYGEELTKSDLYSEEMSVIHRLDFINELAKSCELRVLFEKAGAADRHNSSWHAACESVSASILRRLSHSTDSAVGLEVLKYHRRGDYEAVIVTCSLSRWVLLLAGSGTRPMELNQRATELGLASVRRLRLGEKLDEMLVSECEYASPTAQTLISPTPVPSVAPTRLKNQIAPVVARERALHG